MHALVEDFVDVSARLSPRRVQQLKAATARMMDDVTP
jgi:hypothetical protein